MKFGVRLRELRKKAGLSLRQLADQIGVNFSYLSKIESGALPAPSEKVILKLAEVLKTDKDELLTLAGKIPDDILEILRDREALEFLRSRLLQKKLRREKKEGINIMKQVNALARKYQKGLTRVALPVTLVIAIAASLWFAAPIPLRAFNVAMTVANSPVSGNTTYLLGENISIPATLQFNAGEAKTLNLVSLNITGTESFAKELPILAGNYVYQGAQHGVSGRLDVGVSLTPGVNTRIAGGYGYGYATTTSGNVTYNVRWTPPYTRTVEPPPAPVSLPGTTYNYDISIPSDVYWQTYAYTWYPQGLASSGSSLYTILPASSWNGTAYLDIIVKTNLSGTYQSYINAPGPPWATEALTFVGSNLYAATNEFDYTSWSYKGKVYKDTSVSGTSGNWTAIAGLSNLNAIGGLASDGTNIFIAYRDELTIEKRNPTNGGMINEWDLSNAWGVGMWPPMWGFDALTYGSDLYAAQGEMIIKVNPDTGLKTGEYKTGKWSIRGLEFVEENFADGAYKILYIATTEGKVYRAAKPGDSPQVDKTPIGNYNVELKVVTNPSTTYTRNASFTLGKLTTAPVVTLSAPTPNFAVGTGAEDITISGTINDPSISTVLVGVVLPETTLFSDNVENQSDTLGKWTHSAIGGMNTWMWYQTDDYWQRSDYRSHTGNSYSWRYANSAGNYVSSGGWGANAGALKTQNTIAIGEDNKLTFWTWYDTDKDFWPDRKWVEASTDGVNWQLLSWLAEFWPPFVPLEVTQEQFSKLKMVPAREWTKVEISLAQYANQNIYLRFRFDTMDDWNNSQEGWYIDDLEITGAGFQGQNVNVNPVGANLGFSTTFTLAEGANTITARASRTNYDPKQSGTASVSGSLDKTKPVVTLNAIPTFTKASSQLISGRVIEANFNRLEVKINGDLKWSTSILGANNIFSQTLLLDEGANNIMVIASDKVGLTDNATTAITRDSSGPVFEDVFTSQYAVAYKTGEKSARPGDAFFINLKVTDSGSGVASVKLIVPGPASDWPSAMKKTDLPEAVIDSWGINATTKAAMNYVIPMTLPFGAPAGLYSWTVTAWDTAGNSSNLTVQTKVVTTLEAFNIYLMPDWNLVSTPIMPTTDNITTLTAGLAATRLFERVWYYDASRAGQLDEWKLYVPGVGGDLTRLQAGKGYWFKMKPLTTPPGGETSDNDSFTEAGKVSGPMWPGLPDTPAPVKLTIAGQVLPAGGLAVPPTYTVYAGWNLVGLHSEYALPVSTALQTLTVPQQIWGSLLQYLNYIEFPMEEEGMPKIDLGRFDRLMSSENMEPGRGFWLYMVQPGVIVP